jgi:leucyl/phenylalanyl-tRNA--protein transferase
MKTRLFSILFAMMILTPALSHARDYITNCEAELITIADEFSNPPDDRQAGLITKKIPMTTTSLNEAYLAGIFPWTTDEENNTWWYSPAQRGILPIDRPIQEIIPSRDLQFIRNADKKGFVVTRNQAFQQVMQECAKSERFETVKLGDQSIKIPVRTTWIKQKFLEEFPKLFAEGKAASYEVWKDGRLVGGAYGVTIGGRFSGESMFSIEKNAAKLAIYELIMDEQTQGHTWIDTQQVNGLLRNWHAIEIPRAVFQRKVAEAEQAALPIGAF